MGNILDFESLKARAGSGGSGKNDPVFEDNAEKECSNEELAEIFEDIVRQCEEAEQRIEWEKRRLKIKYQQ